jgi:outer membrane protein, heavy metal efflux system
VKSTNPSAFCKFLKITTGFWPAGLLCVVLTGCKGTAPREEIVAKQKVKIISDSYRPHGQQALLPRLDHNSTISNFLSFAILNQPQVEAAYYEWVASVRRITVERSLPDPKLTFGSDIADIVMAVMPGLMLDFPGPGKLKWAATVATAETETKYFVFENAILQTSFALKKSYYELHFLDAKVDVNRETLRLVRDIEKLARMQNEVGKVTLQDVLRAQIEQERITTEITNLEDSRNPLLAQFKSALGLKVEDATPPVPEKFESTPVDLTSDKLLAAALRRNPRLRAMEAEVRRADASIRLAYKARVPDFSLGLEADVKASPTVFTPQVGITLPIWRDKIAAQIAGAQAEKRASEARLTAEQIALAVEFAEKSFMFREASRNLELLTERLLPKARQSVEVAQSGYVSGKVDFLNLLDAERTLLDFQLSEIEARVQRELALAELSLLIVGTPPSGAPVLPPNTTSRKEREQ